MIDDINLWLFSVLFVGAILYILYELFGKDMLLEKKEEEENLLGTASSEEVVKPKKKKISYS